jgi:activator of HSP90 ATPase
VQASVGEGKEMSAKRPPPGERVNNTYVTSSAEKSKTSQVKISYDFVPPPPVLYETLLDTNRIRGCTASDATMSREVGGAFSMFSGAVSGENVELRPFSEATGDALIKWKWRFSTWQPEHYSTVTITLTDKDGNTKLELVQTGVPEEERERTEKGWKGMLFDRMKAMLGGTVMG